MRKIDFDTLSVCFQIQYFPDILIANFGTNYRIGFQIKKELCESVRNVIIFHGHDISSYVELNGWETYRSIGDHVDAAICVNGIWNTELSQNTDIKKIETIHLGVDIPAKRLSRRKSDSSFDILFVGRFVEKKGFLTLYEAVRSLLQEEKTSIRVHCIGDGPLFTEYKSLVESFIWS